MCKLPAMRAPLSGCVAAYFLRMAMRPGISCSAMAISLRPHSASDKSATANSGLAVAAALDRDFLVTVAILLALRLGSFHLPRLHDDSGATICLFRLLAGSWVFANADRRRSLAASICERSHPALAEARG